MGRKNGSVDDLPDRTQPRILALVERSAPNIDRPPLPAETEHRLDGVERKTAACYAEAEETTFRWRRLARQLAMGPRRGVAR